MPLHFPSGYDRSKALENLGSAARWTLCTLTVAGAAAGALAVVAKFGPWMSLRSLPHKAFLLTGGIAVASTSSLVLLTTQCASSSLPSPPGTMSNSATPVEPTRRPPPARPPSPLPSARFVRSHTPPPSVSLFPATPPASSRSSSPPSLTPSPPSSSSPSPPSSPTDSPPPPGDPSIPVLGEPKEERPLPLPGLKENHYRITDIIGENSHRIVYYENGEWKAQQFPHGDPREQALIEILKERGYLPYPTPEKNVSPPLKNDLFTPQVERKKELKPMISRQAVRKINCAFDVKYTYKDAAARYQQAIAQEEPLPGSSMLRNKSWRCAYLFQDKSCCQIDLRDEEGHLCTRQFMLPKDQKTFDKVQRQLIEKNYTRVRTVDTPQGIVFQEVQLKAFPQPLDAGLFFESLLPNNIQAQRAPELQPSSPFCDRNGQSPDVESIPMTFPQGASAQVRGHDFSLSLSLSGCDFGKGLIGMTIASEISLTGAEGFTHTPYLFYAVLARENTDFKATFASNMQKAFTQIEQSGQQLAGDVMVAKAFDQAFQESIRNLEDVNLTCMLCVGNRLLFQNSGFSRAALINKNGEVRLTGEDSLLTFAEKKEGDYLVLACPGLWNRAMTKEVGTRVRELQPWFSTPDYQSMASTLAVTAHDLDPDNGSVSVMVLQV